jgi:FMN reductase
MPQLVASGAQRGQSSVPTSIRTILTIGGSPAPQSRTERLMLLVDEALRTDGFNVDRLNVRDLPADDLFQARVDAPAIRDAVRRLDVADGVVIATPIYKASYSGILKTFLDLLPQLGLTGKTVLPLAIGGSVAHVLAIDYALRPVLSSLGARHVVGGVFVLDKLIAVDEAGTTQLEAEIGERLRVATNDFTRALRAHAAA